MGPKREEADRPVKAAEDRGKRSGARPHLLGRQPLTSLRGSPSSSPNEELDWGSWVLEFHGPIHIKNLTEGTLCVTNFLFQSISNFRGKGKPDQLPSAITIIS